MISVDIILLFICESTVYLSCVSLPIRSELPYLRYSGIGQRMKYFESSFVDEYIFIIVIDISLSFVSNYNR